MPYEEFAKQSELLLRIVTACICGYLIGYERKNRNKEAGIRTHAIVALGAALIMIVSKYGFSDIADYDASRVAAQIVSGVGFLGAGIIFVKNNSVSGLTTAAGIWATSGIGMAIGSGLYYIGVLATVLIVVVQIVMHKETFLMREPMVEWVHLVVRNEADGLQKVQTAFRSHNIEIVSMEVRRLKQQEMGVDAQIILPAGVSQSELITIMAENESVISSKYER